MHETVHQLNIINNKIKEIIEKKHLKTNPKIIAVTKTFPLEKIFPLLESGHVHYGENKIQEAEIKWTEIKKSYSKIKLHMIGKLQTNKAKKAIQMFDYIHSLDNLKLATKLSQYEKELNKKIKFFIQVNLSEEKQKSGVFLGELNNFYYHCINDLNLNIVGLMCLPPINLNSLSFFETLKNSSLKLKINDLSMGMSSDFENAVSCGSTFLRLGTAIFGRRKTN